MTLDKTIITALISSGSSIITVLIIKPFIDARLLKFQLKLNYRMEQSKKVKDHIAIHKVSLLKAGEFLNKRLRNFSNNFNENWLSHSGNYDGNIHYMDTTVYRFLSFFAYITLIEKDIVYLDATIADKKDLRMIKYFRILNEIMCDVDLYKGHNYDKEFATDHFFTNPFYSLATLMISKENKIIDIETFLDNKVILLPKIRSVYEYFDGITPNETRLRCERIKAFHLILISFLNEYGYDYQYTTSERCKSLKSAYGKFKLIENLKILVKKFKLNQMFGPIELVLKAIK